MDGKVNRYRRIMLDIVAIIVIPIMQRVTTSKKIYSQRKEKVLNRLLAVTVQTVSDFVPNFLMILSL